MLLKTILNRVEWHKSFVYGNGRWAEGQIGQALEVPLRPRANSRPMCSGCGRVGPGYDRLQQRAYRYVPLWGMAVFLLYAPRRVACPACGIKVERVPWAEGKQRLTTSYRWFLARWARRLSWSEVATVFRTSWNTVYRAVGDAVAWGLARRSLEGIEAIGVDEVQWRRGHHYLTLVYQIDGGCKRLLWIGKERTAKTFLGFFRLLGEARSQRLRFVCSDMWKAFLGVVARKASQAIHVLDRYHVMARMNKAIDKVRAQEVKRLKQEGKEPILKHARWCVLKRREHLTESQASKLAELLRCNLQTIRAYLLREEFQRFWDYQSPYWAGRFLRDWCIQGMRSQLEPMKQVARMLRKHEALLLNWFRAKGAISAGVVEGLNYNVKLTMRKAYGFRTETAVKVALYHRLGQLPEPVLTHEFC
jgi:transposase